MLVRFRSSKTGSITMFHDIAVALIKMMGATGRVPGALAPEDVPAALARLRGELEKIPTGAAGIKPALKSNDIRKSRTQDDEDDKEPIIALETRAVPLIQLLERAAAEEGEVIWEQQ